jgi:hypothetical protein
VQDDPEYHVDRVPYVDDQIYALAGKAATEPAKQQLTAALKTALQQLERRPLEWGDPERKTRKKGGVVCHGICAPILVRYVVFEAEHAVIILGINPLPGSGLE